MKEIVLDNLYSAPQADLSYVPKVDETYSPKFISIHGRLGRLRYLAFTWFAAILLTIFFFLIFVAVFFVIFSGVFKETAAPLITKYASEGVNFLVFVKWLLLYLPIVAASLIFTRRRLNDLDHSGWFSFLMLIPFLNVLGFLYLLFAPGSSSDNRYGAKPEKNSALLVFGILVPMLVIGIIMALVMPEYQKVIEQAKAAAQDSAEAAEKHQAP